MTDRRRTGSPRKRGRAGWLVCNAAAFAFVLPAWAEDAAGAQEDGRHAPLSPPAVAPVSRLTITPSEFERWIAGTPERPDVATTPEDQPSGHGLVAPPPPVLATPPPPKLARVPAPPRLTAPPPPAASVPEAPAISTPVAGAQPHTSTPPSSAVNPPPAPVLTPPAAPQVATLPPASRDSVPVHAAPQPPPGEIRILYAAESTDLPAAAREDLDGLAGWLKANPEVRIQIVGYASAATTAGSDARRRSLFRTLAVRTYLIENGVLSTRMDVRALGDRTAEEPKDRVEVRVPPS